VEVDFAWEVFFDDIEDFPGYLCELLILIVNLEALVDPEVARVQEQRAEREVHLLGNGSFCREEGQEPIWVYLDDEVLSFRGEVGKDLIQDGLIPLLVVDRRRQHKANVHSRHS